MANRKFWNTIPWWGWLILGVYCVILIYPFIPNTPWTLRLEQKDFATAWIALGGVVAVVVGIFQTQRRITQQENHFNSQTTLQQKQQRDARFAAGVELLGNPHESTRIGGAYNLYFLARDFEEYRAPVCEILCAHIRTITSDKNYQEKYNEIASIEVQTIIDLLFRKHEKGISIFSGDNLKNLSGAFLCGVTFLNFDGFNTIINHVNFSYATLTYIAFNKIILNKVNFMGAILKYVDFQNATLKNLFFDGATFEGEELNKEWCFYETCLEGYSIEEITRPGRSLELTTPKEENP